jgi:molybdopterin molybdotransferase
VKSVDAHLADILGVVAPLPALELTLAEAHGCVLAEDVYARGSLPPFDNSSMDGYALRSADVARASAAAPVALPVVGDIPAGSPTRLRVQPGFSARIMTGAPVPDGADAVVPLEWTDNGTAEVRVLREAAAGQFIRRAGEDVAAGSLVLAAGSHLGAAQVGLLAAAGRASVVCRPRPRVVVVSTGSELVDAGVPLGHGQVTDVNSYTLAAAAREAGATVYRVGLVRDDSRLLLDTLEDHLIRADLLVTSGGVSVGAYDIVKDVLSRLGTVAFDRVAMQPGMPQGFGTIGPDQVPIITLPGNPVSALVSFEVFVRPALRRMLATEPLFRPEVIAVPTEDLHSPEGKRQYVRVFLKRQPDAAITATPTGGPGSHLLAGFAAANALLVVPEAMTHVPAGSPLPAMLLERRSR